MFGRVHLLKVPKLDLEWPLVSGGVLTYLISVAIALALNMWEKGEYTPGYFKWTNEGRDGLTGAFLLSSAIQCIVMGVIVSVLYGGSADKDRKCQAGSKIGVRAGLIVCITGIASTFMHMLGQIHACQKLGLNGSFFSLVLGIVIGNLPIADSFLNNAKLVKGEDIIKLSLVCLVVPMSLVLHEIEPALIIATPCLLVLAIGFVSLRKIHTEMGTLLAFATSICGASAATAANSVFKFDAMYLSAATGISSIGTVIFMIIVPVVCREMSLNDERCGGWIGGSIDSTGTVLAAADSVSVEAEETAAVVKMTQNLYILPVTLLAMIYKHYFDDSADEPPAGDPEQNLIESLLTASEKTSTTGASVKKENPSIAAKVWEITPKFVLAFVVVGMVNVVVAHTLPHAAEVSNVLSSRWEGIAFILLGMDIRIKNLTGNSATKNGGGVRTICFLFLGYVALQSVDTLVKFGFATLAFP